ncbi:MAG: tetratricopeptide repeat protein [Armatimonas sp.]
MSALGPENENERQAQLLLSKANLLRVRGQLQDAIEACAEALRLAPLSGDACAMLAEIYEAQGKLDDALQWYGMAVDNTPGNPSYREHLKRLAEQKQASLEKQRTEEALVAPKKERTLELEAQSKGSYAARIVWAICGVLFFVVLILFLFFVLPNIGAQRGRQKPMPDDALPQKLAGPDVSQAQTPLPASPSPNGTPQATPTVAPAPANAANAAGITLRLGTDVAYLNPATGLALRESIPQAPDNREVLVRQALRMAAEVSHSDARVKTIQITLKAPGTTIPALIAEIGAYDAIRVSESASLSDLILVFKSLRWPEDGSGAPPGNG